MYPISISLSTNISFLAVNQGLCAVSATRTGRLQPEDNLGKHGALRMMTMLTIERGLWSETHLPGRHQYPYRPPKNRALVLSYRSC